METSGCPVAAQRVGQRPADLGLAGARRPGRRRWPGVPGGRGVALRGHLCLGARCPDGPSPVGERPLRLAVSGTSPRRDGLWRPVAPGGPVDSRRATGRPQQPSVSGVLRSAVRQARRICVRPRRARQPARQLVRGHRPGGRTGDRSADQHGNPRCGAASHRPGGRPAADRRGAGGPSHDWQRSLSPTAARRVDDLGGRKDVPLCRRLSGRRRRRAYHARRGRQAVCRQQAGEHLLFRPAAGGGADISAGVLAARKARRPLARDGRTNSPPSGDRSGLCAGPGPGNRPAGGGVGPAVGPARHRGRTGRGKGRRVSPPPGWSGPVRRADRGPCGGSVAVFSAALPGQPDRLRRPERGGLSGRSGVPRNGLRRPASLRRHAVPGTACGPPRRTRPNEPRSGVCARRCSDRAGGRVVAGRASRTAARRGRLPRPAESRPTGPRPAGPALVWRHLSPPQAVLQDVYPRGGPRAAGDNPGGRRRDEVRGHPAALRTESQRRRLPRLSASGWNAN